MSDDDEKPAIVTQSELSERTDFKPGAVANTPSWAQLNASRFATGILIGVGVIVVLIVVFYWSQLSRLPTLQELIAADPQHGYEIYEKARGLILDQTIRILKDVVLSAFLPLVTLLFGYAFGSAQANKNQ